MYCRCPACRGTVSVPPEQVDFLVRCERCKAFFLARSVEGAQNAALAATAQAESPGECLPAVHLADLLSRDNVAELSGEDLWSQESLLLGTPGEEEVERDAVAEARPRGTFGRKELRRLELRTRQQALGMIGVCGLLAILFLALCVIVLKARTFPRTANASIQVQALPIISPEARQ
jgi:hypothetical protein